jgi:hypothetical protein
MGFLLLVYFFVGGTAAGLYGAAIADRIIEKPILPLWIGTLLFLGWPIALVIGIIVGLFLFGRALYREAAEFITKKGPA